MADRYFPNEFPDFVTEAADGRGEERSPAGVHGLLSLPYFRLSDRLLRATLRIKDKARVRAGSGFVGLGGARTPGVRLISPTLSPAAGRGGDVDQGVSGRLPTAPPDGGGSGGGGSIRQIRRRAGRPDI
ncbi:hypothetical protein E2562_034910 [Oryza meyeriana var. granulata]|uniref:Uncharacterized protein n=1 Tax=Oryza meyeriana var. granulata TaxID=110450 RepID=A0A6G1F1J9_9ORYZ|nr:hypothetical protein E2562_034910 [Oryza meyeriana var. granulata]